MWFRVDPRLPTPVYQQIVDGVKEAVAKGVLPPGERLPSVREMAALMTLNHNTVAKAYQELERERVIDVLRGRGTFVAEPGRVPDREDRIGKMADTIKQLLVEAHHLRMTDRDLLQMVQDIVSQWTAARGGDEV